MVTGMMENEKFIQESSRCIYENNDILVQHAFMSYPDDSREAVMLVAMLKDGKIISMETGATPLEWVKMICIQLDITQNVCDIDDELKAIYHSKENKRQEDELLAYN